jgi:hypothetical protein
MELDLHRRLMSELKLLDDQGDLQPIALADGSLGSDLLPVDDDGLHPSGTSFFGLGGGPEVNPVVNPVNLRRAAFLAEKAQDAPAQDAAFLLDEALQVADGKPAFVEIPDNAVPVVSEDGLRKFQQANIAYRRARSDSLAASQNYDAAERNRRIAEEVRQRMLKERSEGKLTPDRQHLLQEAELAFRRLSEEANHDRQASSQALALVAWTNALRRLTLMCLGGAEPTLPAVLQQEHDALDPGIQGRLFHYSPLVILFREYASQLQDERLGEQYGFVDDPAMQSRAERIVDRLRLISPYPNEPAIVRVLDFPKDPRVAAGMEDNAGAIGNRIFIGRKLLSTLDDDQLMFVVGHEMGHNIHDHAIQELGNLGLDKARDWWNGESDTAGLTAKQQSLAKAIRIADFTRPNELEADREGAYLALAAGAKPEGIRKFLQWDAQRTAQAIAAQETAYYEEKHLTMPAAKRKLLEQLMDHPPAQQRYSLLEDIYGTTLLRPLEPN